MKFYRYMSIVMALLVLFVSCATKNEEKAKEDTTAVEIEAKATEKVEEKAPSFDQMSAGGNIPNNGNTRNFQNKGGMNFGGGMMNQGLSEDVEFSSTIDIEGYIGSYVLDLDEEDYQDYTVLLGKDGTVGTTRMLTELSVEVKDGVLVIKNSSKEKYNIILSGEWEGGVQIESKKADVILTLAEANITSSQKPALALKGENTVYIRSIGSSSLSDAATNEKKGVVTSGGDIVFFGDGEITVNGYRKHGLKTDGTVEVASGSVVINIDEKAEGNGISADDAFLMNGGRLTINASGSVYGEESKGIKVNGREGDNPKGWIVVNGGEITIESVGKGMTAGFEAEDDGLTETRDDDPTPDLTINGGVVRIHAYGTPYEVSDTESLSPEGLEAKNNLVINGGYVEVVATDDALNAGNLIEINGGYLFALSRGDDGADSNGSIRIAGGTTIVVGNGGIGLGIDCDFDQRITYEGGTVIGIGGGNNAPTTGNHTSFSFDTSSSSFALLEENSRVVAAFRMPYELSSSRNVVVMSESIGRGKTYSVVEDCSISGEEYFNGLYLGTVTIEGGSLGYSATANSTASGYHYSMGGMGGFGGGQKGRDAFWNIGRP